MEKKVLIVEKEEGWTIFDAENGDTVAEGFLNLDESLRLCNELHFQLPYMGESGKFFEDLNGEPLFLTDESKKESLELEYSDGTPFFDFELCPVCKGPAVGRPIAEHNCYYCSTCDKNIDCVPPPEWIGEAD